VDSLEDLLQILDHVTPEKLEEVRKRVEDTLHDWYDHQLNTAWNTIFKKQRVTVKKVNFLNCSIN